MRYAILFLTLTGLLAVACDGGEEGERPTPVVEAPTSTPSPEPAATPPRPSGISHYRNPVYGVEFDYPTSWVADTQYSLASYGYPRVYRDLRGREFGWFNVGAHGAPSLSLDEVTERSSGHKLMPYGENPQVLSLVIPAGEARLILPDEVFAPEPFNAQLVMAYPSPISLPTGSYNYFSLVAHKDFIRAIADTLRFTVGPVTPPPSP